MTFKLTFENFMNVYYTSLRTAMREDQRPGQWFFNCLRDERPDIAEAIRGTPFDPFYQDSILHRAISKVDLLWDQVTINTGE